MFRTLTVLVVASVLLAACPAPPRPLRPRPEPRRAPPSPEAVLARWVKGLDAAIDRGPLDLGKLVGAGRPVTGNCTGSARLIRTIFAPDRRGVVVLGLLLPPGASADMRRDGRREMAPCFVRAEVSSGTVHLAGYSLGEQFGSAGAARFEKRSACTLLRLELNVESDDPAKRDAGPRRESVSYFVWRDKARRMVSIGSYELRSRVGGETPDAEGKVHWVRVGGRHYVVYRATHPDAPTALERNQLTVERLDPDCTLDELDPPEVEKLRRLPDGKKLPSLEAHVNRVIDRE